MAEEKDLEIILDDPKTDPKKDEPEVLIEGDEPAVKAVDENDESNPEVVLRKMEKKLERANKKAEKFEREKAEAEAKAYQAMAEAGENRKHVMLAAINQVKNDAETLQSQFAEAMSLNNFELAGKIQQQMAANEVRKLQFESELENLKRQEGREAPQQAGSQLDQIISAVSATSASWLKENREHLNNDKAIRRMFRAHEDAVDDGITPDTDEYFEFIEKRLGISSEEREEKAPKQKVEADEEDTPMSAAAKPKPKATQPPPAPVERYSNRPNVVRLTRAEAETAQMLGMTEKEYAMHKLALQKEGKLPH